jgi:hypothetical protein
MRTVYKYPIHNQSIQTISVPGYLRTLHCAEQVGILMLWCMVDSEKLDNVNVIVEIVCTGDPAGRVGSVPKNFLNTVLRSKSGFVQHVYTAVSA